MKRASFYCVALVVTTALAQAHPYVPPIDYLGSVDKVCIARVTSSQKEKVTFSVIKQVKGTSPDTLTLIPVLGFPFPQGSEWFLMHLGGLGYWENHVGYLISGDCEWLPAVAVRSGNTYYFQTSILPGDKIALDTLPDGTKGLSLDKIKSLLQAEPVKH